MFKSKNSFGAVSRMVAILLFAVASAGAASLISKRQASSSTQESKSATKPKPKIKTSKGDFEIEGVQESERFPPDCQNPTSPVSPSCFQAAEGHKILLVWLKIIGEGGLEPGRIDTGIFKLSEGVYVAADDSFETKRHIAGNEGELFYVGFTPAKTARNFKLYWPGNSPIELSIVEKRNSTPKKP